MLTVVFEIESDAVEPSNIRYTPREKHILQLVAKGLTNKEIASQVFLSERTVKFHVSSLLAKNHCKNRIQLVLGDR